MPARDLFDLLVPSRCLGCDQPHAAALCSGCASALTADGRRFRIGPHLTLTARLSYGAPIDRAIKRVKTAGLHEAAKKLAGLLTATVARLDELGYVVTWVPASTARRRRRGLDLAQVLAGDTARPLLRRTRRHGRDQPGLTAAQRLDAPFGAFAAAARAIPARVVLIDDVRTTGATLTAAAAPLISAGAHDIIGLSLAAPTSPPRVRQLADRLRVWSQSPSP